MRINPLAQPADCEAPPTERSAPGLLTVDLGALAANWRLLSQRSAPAECAAVVKAEGYGIGLEPAMRALLAAGCRTFFVTTLSEGEAARAADGGATIYVLEGVAPGAGPRLFAAGLRPVLGSLAEIDEWAALGRSAGRRLEAALHIDTGMNRVGLSPQDAGEAAARAQGVSLTLLMSHFVSSQQPQDPHNSAQIEAFAALRETFSSVPGSLCNSSGIFLPQKPTLDLTRPGYALYGGNPTPGLPNPMRPVVRLEARIVATRDIGAGESVGYDAVWTAKRPTRLATISAGYADGIPLSASGEAGRPAAEAAIAGVRCPYVGRVSMDFVVLDVTDAPESAARRGEFVDVIGPTIGVDELAARCGTIGYEILTRLGRRYARRYIGA
jgi:alanine racemase